MVPGLIELLMVIFLFFVVVTTIALGVAWGIRWGLKWVLKDITSYPKIEYRLKRIFKQSEE